jgi:hypothetical protein
MINWMILEWFWKNRSIWDGLRWFEMAWKWWHLWQETRAKAKCPSVWWSTRCSGTCLPWAPPMWFATDPWRSFRRGGIGVEGGCHEDASRWRYLMSCEAFFWNIGSWKYRWFFRCLCGLQHVWIFDHSIPIFLLGTSLKSQFLAATP